MARQGLHSDQVIAAIRELQAQGTEVTVTAIRDRLGSGSYSTISSVLNDWRKEQAKTAQKPAPEIPERVHLMTRQFWAEAWKSADSLYEPERQAVARERQEYEQAKQELTAEVRRLEHELEQAVAERQSCREELACTHLEHEATRLELAKASSALQLLQVEADSLRKENQATVEKLTAWIERATKAETQLEMKASSKAAK